MPVGGSRHYVGGGLGDERGWKCPACGAENLVAIAQGCQTCGSGAPGHKGEPTPPPPPPAFTMQAPEGEEQLGLFDRWALAHPQATIEQAFEAGYIEGFHAAITTGRTPTPPPQSPPEPIGPDATIARTVVAALELFRDQILAGDPEEVRTGEWLSADQVTAFIQQIIQTEAAHA